MGVLKGSEKDELDCISAERKQLTRKGGFRSINAEECQHRTTRTQNSRRDCEAIDRLEERLGPGQNGSSEVIGLCITVSCRQKEVSGEAHWRQVRGQSRRCW